MKLPYIEIFVFIWYTAWLAAILGYGSGLSRLVSNKQSQSLYITRHIGVIGISGFAVVSVIGHLLNFFLPIHSLLSTAVLAGGLVLFCFNFKRLKPIAESGYFVLVAVFVLYTALYIYCRVSIYDTGLYHLQAVRWTKEAQLPFGLANLHHRFGYNSAWFVIGAVMEPPRQLVSVPFLIINPAITFFYGLSILLSMRKLVVEKFAFSDAFFILSFVPWFRFLGNRTASLNNDVPIFIMICLLVYLVIYAQETREIVKADPRSAGPDTAAQSPGGEPPVTAGISGDAATHYRRRNRDIVYFYILFFSFFSLTIKLSSAAIVFSCIVLVLGRRLITTRKQGGFWTGSRRFVWLVSFAFLLITVTSMVRGFILSGAPLYPSKVLYSPHLKWAVPEKGLEMDVIRIRTFAKHPKPGYMKYYGNWKWFPQWLKVRKKNLIFIALSGLMGCFMLFFFPILKIKKNEWLQFVIPLCIVLGGMVFWFFSAPAIRFGYAYLVSFSGLMLAFPLYKWCEFLELKLKTFSPRVKLLRGIGGIVPGHLTLFLFTAVILIPTCGNIPALGIILLLLLFVLIKFPRIITPVFICTVLLCMALNSVHTGYLRNNLTAVKRIPAHNVMEVKTESGVSLYKPTKGNQCWDCPLMCTPMDKSKLKIAFSRSGVPRMFYFDKDI